MDPDFRWDDGSGVPGPFGKQKKPERRRPGLSETIGSADQYTRFLGLIYSIASVSV